MQSQSLREFDTIPIHVPQPSHSRVARFGFVTMESVIIRRGGDPISGLTPRTGPTPT